MKRVFESIWKDSVGGNLIAWILISLLSYLISSVPQIKAQISLILIPYGIAFNVFVFMVIGMIFFLVFLLFAVRKLDKKRDQKKYHKYFHSHSGEILTIKQVLEKAPRITKIAVVGISKVGKTTLIENLCSLPNKKVLTQGKNAYVINFSDQDYKYAVLFDGSGQSQATQNDLAMDANILIVLLDHNPSSIKNKLLKNRLERQEQFVQLLLDRFKTSSKYPQYVFLQLNKSDLWKDKGDDASLRNFLTLQEKALKNQFSGSTIWSGIFSNEILSDRTSLRIELSKIIK